MKKVGVVLSLIALALAGCAAKQKPDVVKATNGSRIKMQSIIAPKDWNENRYGDKALREVQTSTTAGMIGLQVAASAVVSVLTHSVAVGGSSFDKEDLKGTIHDEIPEPTATYLYPKIKATTLEWLEKNGGGYRYKRPLWIAASTWLLVYKSLNNSADGFELRYTVQFVKKPENGTMFTALEMKRCVPTPKTDTLENWQKDNYALVKSVTQQYMDQCLWQFKSELPGLMKH